MSCYIMPLYHHHPHCAIYGDTKLCALSSSHTPFLSLFQIAWPAFSMSSACWLVSIVGCLLYWYTNTGRNWTRTRTRQMCFVSAPPLLLPLPLLLCLRCLHIFCRFVWYFAVRPFLRMNEMYVWNDEHLLVGWLVRFVAVLASSYSMTTGNAKVDGSTSSLPWAEIYMNMVMVVVVFTVHSISTSREMLESSKNRGKSPPRYQIQYFIAAFVQLGPLQSRITFTNFILTMCNYQKILKDKLLLSLVEFNNNYVIRKYLGINFCLLGLISKKSFYTNEMQLMLAKLFELAKHILKIQVSKWEILQDTREYFAWVLPSIVFGKRYFQIKKLLYYFPESAKIEIMGRFIKKKFSEELYLRSSFT